MISFLAMWIGPLFVSIRAFSFDSPSLPTAIDDIEINYSIDLIMKEHNLSNTNNLPPVEFLKKACELNLITPKTHIIPFQPLYSWASINNHEDFLMWLLFGPKARSLGHSAWRKIARDAIGNRQLKVLKEIISCGHIEPDFYCHESSLIWIALDWDLDFFIWLLKNFNTKWEPEQWYSLLEILVRRKVEKNIYKAAKAIAKNRGGHEVKRLLKTLVVTK